MRNLPDWVMAFWATISVGAVAVPLNAWWTGEELAYGLSDSGSRVAFVDEERQQRVAHHLAEVPGLEALIVSCEEHDPDTGGRRAAVAGHLDREGAEPLPVVPFTELVGSPADDLALPEVTIDADDDATIFYTSGTTGRPKGAVGTHRNSCSNLMNLFFVATVGSLRRSQAQKDASPGVQNANLLSVPLFHATGCHALLVTNTAAGGKLVMMHTSTPSGRSSSSNASASPCSAGCRPWSCRSSTHPTSRSGTPHRSSPSPTAAPRRHRISCVASRSTSRRAPRATATG